MTAAELRAQAATADRQADAIFDAMEEARRHAPADYQGARPLVPAGFEGRVQEASDLRRRAEYLRAEAADMARPAAPPRVSLPSAHAPSPSSRPFVLTPRATTATPSQPEVDPVDAVVARIMSS